MKIVSYTLEVTTNNFFLSSFVGELKKGENDRIGFLLGSITDKEIAKVEVDSSDELGANKTRITRTISLENYVFLPTTKPSVINFKTLTIDFSGEEIQRLISKFSAENCRILGVFVYRPVSQHFMSLQEMALFHNIVSTVPKEVVCESDRDQFLFCLMTSKYRHPLHSFEYSVYRSPSSKSTQSTSSSKKEVKNEEEKAKAGTEEIEFFEALVNLPLTVQNIEDGLGYVNEPQCTGIMVGQGQGGHMKELERIEFKETAEKLKNYVESEVRELRKAEKRLVALDMEIFEKEKMLSELEKQ